jgi:hypothetical protein
MRAKDFVEYINGFGEKELTIKNREVRGVLETIIQKYIRGTLTRKHYTIGAFYKALDRRDISYLDYPGTGVFLMALNIKLSGKIVYKKSFTKAASTVLRNNFEKRTSWIVDVQCENCKFASFVFKNYQISKIECRFNPPVNGKFEIIQYGSNDPTWCGKFRYRDFDNDPKF